VAASSMAPWQERFCCCHRRAWAGSALQDRHPHLSMHHFHRFGVRPTTTGPLRLVFWRRVEVMPSLTSDTNPGMARLIQCFPDAALI